MTIIRNTEDLIAVARSQVPDTACARYLGDTVDRTITFHGQFGASENRNQDCWILSVFSPHGREYIVVVRAKPVPGEYHVWLMQDRENIPWRDWRGERGGRNPLVDGTHPSDADSMRKEFRLNGSQSLSELGGA